MAFLILCSGQKHFLIELNAYPTSPLHDMGVCYDPAVGGKYDARSGGHSARQQIRVSVLPLTIRFVPGAKDLHNAAAHSLRKRLKRRANLMKWIKTSVCDREFRLHRRGWLVGLRP